MVRVNHMDQVNQGPVPYGPYFHNLLEIIGGLF